MYERTLRYGKGYSGKMSKKCWIAAITGSDTQYGLSRSFLEPSSVEREHFNRARTMIDFTWQLNDGLYEFSEGGERWYVIVWTNAAGETKRFKPEEYRVKAMVALMDGGMSADEARRATKPAPQPTEQPKGE